MGLEEVNFFTESESKIFFCWGGQGGGRWRGRGASVSELF